MLCLRPRFILHLTPVVAQLFFMVASLSREVIFQALFWSATLGSWYENFSSEFLAFLNFLTCLDGKPFFHHSFYFYSPPTLFFAFRSPFCPSAGRLTLVAGSPTILFIFFVGQPWLVREKTFRGSQPCPFAFTPQGAFSPAHLAA